MKTRELFWAGLVVFAAGCDIGAPGNEKLPPTGGQCSPCQFLGQDAMCLPDTIPQVAAALADPTQGPALRAGASACGKANEVCVPCVDPTTGQNTGACQLGATSCTGQSVSCETAGADILNPTDYAPCAADAHCLPANLVASAGSALQEQLATCPNDANSYCVPDHFIRTGGAYTPPTCTSVAGAEGRCLSTVLPAISERGALLPQATCAATERCAPCYDPLTGEDSGACRTTCDTGPTSAAVVLTACEDNGGRCIPTTSISAAQQGVLDPRDCQDTVGAGYMCVPTIILANGPYTRCSGNGFFVDVDNGVCLPTNILNIDGSGFLPSGNCDEDVGDGYKCVPCIRDGRPTGAPGCTP